MEVQKINERFLKKKKKINERVEKQEDRKYLVFSCMCLIGGVEKWKG